MPPTRNGVYHDLSETPWTYELQTREQRIVFRFATRGHWLKFCNLLPQRVAAMNATMGKRIGVPVDMEAAAALQLYRQVETFGFLVEVDGETWPRENLEFAGLRLKTSACEAPSSPSIPPCPTPGG